MRTNRSGVTEVASIRADQAKYEEGWERIFGKKESNRPSVEPSLRDEPPAANTAYNTPDHIEAIAKATLEAEKLKRDENMRIKKLARVSFQNLDCCQGAEGGPDGYSYIYGFMEGFKAAKEEK